jgi:hypothetical protein
MDLRRPVFNPDDRRGAPARDYERLPETLAGFHFLAFAILLLTRFVAKTRLFKG